MVAAKSAQQFGGMIPFTTASGQLQFSMSSPYQGSDMFFNRNVVKPIRGGGGGAIPYQNPHQAPSNAYSRNDSSSRTRQQLTGLGGRNSTGGFLTNATPLKNRDGFGAPLIKPEFQKQYSEKLNQVGTQS